MDNDKNEEWCAEAAKQIAFHVFKCGFKDLDDVRVLVEMNFNGNNWVNKFKSHPQFYDLVILKSPRGMSSNGKPNLQYGFRTTGGQHGKNYYCELGA